MGRKKLVRAIAMLLALSLAGCGSQPINDILPASEETGVEEERILADGELHAKTEEVAQQSTEKSAKTDEAQELTQTQKNSIAMLNYLAMLSQQINSSKNSRMYLEKAYDALINNTNPENVNELTESHLSSLLDIIEKYRMISIKRDRLEYIYNQNKALAIKEAVPNPIGVLSAVSSFDFAQLAASVIYTAVDSLSSYNAYNTEIEQRYLQDGWELDDEESENLHDSRKRAFLYMIDIVQEYGIPGELALNEASIEKFVTYQNKTNNAQKIQFFESEKSTYNAFGSYWLELAECYYTDGEYEKCLKAIDTYESLQTKIFRKDYEYAQALPDVLVAAEKVYSGNTYVKYAEVHLKKLVENTEMSEWSLRYFAAQMYMDLYAKTDDSAYLNKAFQLILNNVNYLVEEQNTMNSTYLSAVQEVTASDTVTKDEKKQIKEYNKSLRDRRKTELPPVYEPLVVNCELLFALADKTGLSDSQKTRVDAILNSVFLSTAIAQKYSFDSETINVNAYYDADTLVLPASILSENSVIKVSVLEGGSTAVYDDWTVKKVDRPNGDGDFESFAVTYTSKTAEKQKWSEDSTVKVEIIEPDINDSTCVINFKVSSYKKVLMVTTVDFEQVC